MALKAQRVYLQQKQDKYYQSSIYQELNSSLWLRHNA